MGQLSKSINVISKHNNGFANSLANNVTFSLIMRIDGRINKLVANVDSK
jgi:hypothetical protein